MLNICRLGTTVYSFLYFGRAIAASIGIVASSVIMPRFGWFGCFVFFGILTLISFGLLLIFNEMPLPVSTKIKERRNPNNASPLLGQGERIR